MPRPQDVIDMGKNADDREYVLKHVSRQRLFTRICIR